jgi:diguanylate cyclase (GGDEF)-like protein
MTHKPQQATSSFPFLRPDKKALCKCRALQSSFFSVGRGSVRPAAIKKNGGSINTILAWAGICTILVAALWASTLYKLDAEKQETMGDALMEATYRSQSYSEQLTRSIEQIDQIAFHLEYEWRESGGQLDLTKEAKQGIFPLVSHLHAWIADRDGAVLTSTRHGDEGKNVREEAYFHVHPTTAEALYIGDPTSTYLNEDSVVHFSRMIRAPDGSFAGVVVIAAEPAYLESFTHKLALGASDSVTLKKPDGAILASRRGANIRSIPTIYRTPSVFSTDKGVIRAAGEHFIDNKARIVAWNKLSNYPLVSIVNQSEDDVFADYREMEQDYMQFAIMGTLLLFLFSTVGISFTAKLTKRRKQANEIRYTYRLATEAAREGFFMVSALYGSGGEIDDFVIEDCNDRGADFMGFSKSSLIGNQVSALFAGQQAQQFLEICRSAMALGFHEDEIKLARRGAVGESGAPLWINRRMMRSGEGLALTLRDISEAKAHEQELAKLANTDALTVLPNRHWLRNYLPRALEQAKKSQAGIAVLFIDIDNFKNINDTLGHQAGDELLRSVAQRIKALLRPGDHVVRLGGDEFTVLSEGHEGNASVCPLAERILQAMNEPFRHGSQLLAVGASIGISVYQEDSLDSETLLKHADIAMYEAKSQGKGRYQFYQPHMLERLVARVDTEVALRSAIDVDEFVLYYQPRVSTMTGEARGLEALIRWRHPTRGIVLPAEFIPFAEEAGLIVELGALVIEKACRQIAQWRLQGVPLVPVSVNVSAHQLNDGSLLQRLRDSIHRHGIDVSLLELELTESSMLIEKQQVMDELATIKKMGIKLLIDDFGTGYSSMSQLQTLDMDVLKIDRSFTCTLARGHEGEAFFMAMISMAHVLGMTVVAEGVETREELMILQSLSCDEVQGYLISRPMPAEQIPACLARQTLFS